VARGGRRAGYYVLRSRLAANVYKLGVTTSLERRVLEHGGMAKHEVVLWQPMPEEAAYKLESRIKTAFHRCRVTDGNEIFVLTDEDLTQVVCLAKGDEIT
jgi:predicted GIY-YIG superfamily endonuclease